MDMFSTQIIRCFYRRCRKIIPATSSRTWDKLSSYLLLKSSNADISIYSSPIDQIKRSTAVFKLISGSINLICELYNQVWLGFITIMTLVIFETTRLFQRLVFVESVREANIFIRIYEIFTPPFQD